jgi:hypothetical protein
MPGVSRFSRLTEPLLQRSFSQSSQTIVEHGYGSRLTLSWSSMAAKRGRGRPRKNQLPALEIAPKPRHISEDAKRWERMWKFCEHTYAEGHAFVTCVNCHLTYHDCPICETDPHVCGA